MKRRESDVPIYALVVGTICVFLGVVALILLGSAIGAVPLHVVTER